MGSIMIDPTKLYPKLQELKICTGGLGKNEIAALHDSLSFNNTHLTFIDWFQTILNDCYCMDLFEILAYKELTEQNIVLDESEYSCALKEYEQDIETNERECQKLQANIEYYQEELEHYKKDLTNGDIYNEKLKKLMTMNITKLSNLEFQRDKALKMCFETAKVLDNLNQDMVETYERIVNEIINNSNPSHETMVLSKFTDFVDKFEAVGDINVNNENDCNAINLKLVTSEINLDYNDVDTSETMRGRLINVFRLHMKLLCDSTVDNDLYLSFNISETSNILKQKHIEWETTMLQYINDYINLSIANEIAETITNYEPILDSLIQSFTNMLQVLDALSIFNKNIGPYMKMLEDIQTVRIKQMRAINDDYNMYCLKPVEQKYHGWYGFKEILKIIGANTNLNLNDAVLAIKKFEGDYEAMEREFFIDSLDEVSGRLCEIEKTNKDIVSFLSNKATGKVTVIPSNVHVALKKESESVIAKSLQIKLASGLPKAAKQKLEADKKLKLGRQLWMYYLRKPEKMKRLIEEYEQEEQKKRCVFLNS